MKKRDIRSKETNPLPDPIPKEPKIPVERVQLGVRIEKRLAKVLKGVAESADLTVGEMLEEILLHSFVGAQAFGPKAQKKIEQLKAVYDLDYDAHASYRFEDKTKER
jgi:predicted type IV restriction endonuclease